MNDPKLDYKNEFPVELVNPDISPYKRSNTGIDYIITCLLYTSDAADEP